MTEKSLKNAFAVSAVLCVCLASILAYVLWRHWSPSKPQLDADPVVARGPEIPSQSSDGSKARSTIPEGASLTPIQISPQRMQEIGVTTAVAEIKEVSDELQAPGTVAIDEQRLSYVQTRFAGWIHNVFANATYQYVRKGQNLFTIYSPDVVSTEQEYLLAKNNQKSVSERMHGMPADESNWLLQAAAERLRRFDVPDAEIAQLDSSGTANREIAIQSPSSGYIVERNALPNAYILPETKLYTIADLSTVWVYANVPQTDVGRLKPGDRAQVSVDAYPARRFNGRIDQILPDVDLTTRTVRVRLVLSNPGVALKPGMYVNVDIAAPLGRQLVIPASGVLQAGSREIAFIDRGQGSLEPREIETGPTLGESIVVLKGLEPGDRIVSSANFLVDSEAQLQTAMASFTPASGQDISSHTKATEQLHIEFSTEPGPPRKGVNTVRIRLTGPDDKPVSGVQASAMFFMPAMPAMGMAAQRASASLVEKGNGNYEGPLHLDAGGTWQVTITVQRAGMTIATKQFSVSATGGME